MTFEEAMQKLEELVGNLETGELSLDESLRTFEEGMQLVEFCEKRLDEVDRRIQVLLQEGDHAHLQDWTPEESDSTTDSTPDGSETAH